MVEKTKNPKVANLASDLEKLTKHLVERADDACDFEDVLNKAIHSLFLAQPSGKKNYECDKLKIGRVFLENDSVVGAVKIEYKPSIKIGNDMYLANDSITIGAIDIRKRTYSLEQDIKKYDKSFRLHHNIPLHHKIPIVLRDTEMVMKSLGLTSER